MSERTWAVTAMTLYLVAGFALGAAGAVWWLRTTPSLTPAPAVMKNFNEGVYATRSV